MAYHEIDDLNKEFIDSEHTLNVRKKGDDMKLESEEDIRKASFESYESHFADNFSDDEFILNLSNCFYKLFNTHYEPAYVVNLLRQYFKDNNTDPKDTFNQLIKHRNQLYFTSMIGYFYQFGIGTEEKFL
ncbi:5257_t:CDS:2 [Scutellospora calospora]|uniref:5257_t:CDS:1 n=1 Tax=Scutellospora calospora TaxID=85575 RepID=A0ACA9KIV0_9GLOM|nr:5257_t:CDS:2 [Scutellospora calospora]